MLVDKIIKKEDKTLCMISYCNEKHVIDYNGCNCIVCQLHYDKLNDEFDEEYD